jgi:hypothetical protein
MPSAKGRPRWWFVITPRWLAWHAFAVVAAWGMLWLGDWQFHRAEGGNALSWAYTFEWPLFVIFGVVFWAKTITDEYRYPGGKAKQQAAARQLAAAREPDGPGAQAGELMLPATAHTPVVTDDFDDADDPELAAYNAYLTRLSSARPAGGQPGPAVP